MIHLEQVKLQPDPYAPYAISQAIHAGQFLFISGQTPVNDRGEVVSKGDFDGQAEQVFQNLNQVLQAGGSSFKDIVKVTIYLTDMSNFPKIVALRRKWFSTPYPADTIVQVQSLFSADVLLEIEAIAVIREEAK